MAQGGGRASGAAVVVAVVAAIAETVAAVVAGRVAGGPTAGLVGLLLVGSALLEVAGQVALAGAVGRAEGRLRADLLHTALHQPLPALDEQAVGELIDRIDDDNRQLGVLVRRTGWPLLRSALRSTFAWVVAGLTWWPAWIAFPLIAALVVVLVRPIAPVLARRKLAEETAWSDHCAQLEEAVAARDDVRSSLGQPHVVRQYAQRAGIVLRRAAATRSAPVAATVATGLVLHAALAAVAVGGAALVSAGGLGVAELVTLWLLVTMFTGQLTQVTDRLPEVQAGIGALARIRGLLTAPQEPLGGAPVPPGSVVVAFRGLTAGYPGGFTVRGIDIDVPAGGTCALVGRTGAGKSTLVKLVAYVGQLPRVLSGTFDDNISLGHRPGPDGTSSAVADARLQLDVDDAGGLHTLVGHRGVRLSGGQVQRLALARALAAGAELLVADDVSSALDARTEVELWEALRRRGVTVVGASSERAALARADHVLVLDGGRVAAGGTWSSLAGRWGHLAG